MTRLAGMADPRDGTVHTVVPLYEDLAVTARDLYIPGIENATVVLSGWGRVAYGDPLDDEALTGDLDLAYFEGHLLRHRITVRAGRQLIASGRARNLQLDGLLLRSRLGAGFGIEAYGGAPVTPRFGSVRGQAAVGGRLFWRPGPRFEGGVSFVHLLTDGRVDRQELGADARLRVTEEISLAGSAAFSTVEARLAEATLRALWQPQRNLELDLEVARTAPDLFVSRASIFSVFSEESRDEAGAAIFWRPHPKLRLWADGYVISEESGVGGRGGVRGTLNLDAMGRTILGLEARTLAVPWNGYWQWRAFGVRRLSPAFLATLDADATWLRDALNDQRASLTVAGTLGWDFRPGWRAVVTGIAGTTPLVASRFEAMAKVVYNLDVHMRVVKP